MQGDAGTVQRRKSGLLLFERSFFLSTQVSHVPSYVSGFDLPITVLRRNEFDSNRPGAWPLGKEGRKDQEFKVILGYMVSLRSIWAT